MTRPGSRLRPHATVLVTGASGFIGSAVTEELLRQGYGVVATGRELDKFEELREKFGPSQRYTVVEVRDMEADDAFREAIRGCSAVIHCAHDLSWSRGVEETVEGSKRALYNLLEEARRAGTVRAFAYTSSRHAWFKAHADMKAEQYVGPDEMIHDAYERALAMPQGDHETYYMTYSAAKVECEKLALQYAKDHKPGFVVNTLAPDFTIGAPSNPRSLRYSSHSVLRGFVERDGDPSFLHAFTSPATFWVAIADIAAVLVALVTDPEVSGVRILGATGLFCGEDFLDIARRFDGRDVHDKSRSTLQRNEGLQAPEAIEAFKALVRKHCQREPIDLKTCVLENIRHQHSLVYP